jgi:hypothetical protein
MDVDDRGKADIVWSRNVAHMAIDELVEAGLVPRHEFDRAVEIAAREILIRLAL